MGSIHNDLATWASRAIGQGFTTIEIGVREAIEASDLIVEQANEIDDLKTTISNQSQTIMHRDAYIRELQTTVSEMHDIVARKTRRIMTKDDLVFISTSKSHPEEYDVFLDQKQVGYVRLRYSMFTVQVPDVDGPKVFKAVVEYGQEMDGLVGEFKHGEREHWLGIARDRIWDHVWTTANPLEDDD